MTPDLGLPLAKADSQRGLETSQEYAEAPLPKVLCWLPLPRSPWAEPHNGHAELLTIRLLFHLIFNYSLCSTHTPSLQSNKILTEDYAPPLHCPLPSSWSALPNFMAELKFPARHS